MSAYGMAREFQDAIMDPRFTDIRLRETCAHWIKDTVENRYNALRETRDDFPPEEELTMTSAAGAMATHSAPGCVALYKATALWRSRGVLDANATGRLSCRLSGLDSIPAGDFGSRASKMYFFADFCVVQRHAAYLQRRAGQSGGSVVIVKMQIPEAALEALRARAELLSLQWPDAAWRQLVYYSRTGSWAYPEALEPYQDATLVVGPAAAHPNVRYRALADWTQVDEGCLMRIGGELVVQYGFAPPKRYAFLRENAIVSIQPYSRADYEQWLEDNGTEPDDDADEKGTCDTCDILDAAVVD